MANLQSMDRLAAHEMECTEAPTIWRRWPTIILATLAWLPICAHGQMLSAMGSASYSSTTGESSVLRPYEVGYRQYLYKDFSLTFDYINEGHFTDHHPDGYGLEFWYSFPSPITKYFSVSVGAGSFYYFDTVPAAGGSSTDLHGLAPMVSVAARARLSKKWSVLVSADWIDPTHDIKSEMLSVGLGYWLVNDDIPVGENPTGILERLMARTGSGKTEHDEFALYGVISTINIAGNPSSFGGSAEYRYRFDENVEATLAYIYEGDPQVARRSGLTAQIWPVRYGTGGFEIGAGFGGYVFVDKKRQPIPGKTTTAAVAPVVSLMVSHSFRGGWFARLIWDRVISNYNRDADIYRFGLGHTI
jgi:hypothetical protein